VHWKIRFEPSNQNRVLYGWPKNHHGRRYGAGCACLADAGVQLPSMEAQGQDDLLTSVQLINGWIEPIRQQFQPGFDVRKDLFELHLRTR
jgi:hypothetical protein